MHLAVLLRRPLLDKFLDEEVVNKFIADELALDLPSMDGVSSDFLGNQETGGDVYEVVVFCDLFAQRCPAAKRRPHYDDLRADSGNRADGLDTEGFLGYDMATLSSLMMKLSSRLAERSISRYLL